jgi:hypothetical protein
LAWTAPLAELRLVLDYFLSSPPRGRWKGVGPVFYWGLVQMGGPPSYHTVMLALTTPLPVLLIGLPGAWVCWRRHRSAAGLLCAWVAVVLGRHAILGLGNYDGVRHVIDAFPAFAIVGGAGAAAVFGAVGRWMVQRVGRGAAAVVSLVGLLLLVGPGVRAIATLHPYPVTYYNALVGGLRGAASRFEAEYSGAAYREGLEWAAAHLSERDLLWVGRNHNDYLLVKIEAEYLGLARPEIVAGPPPAVAAGWPGNGGRVFYMGILRPGPFERNPRGVALARLPLVHEVRRDGVPLLRIREVRREVLPRAP